MEVSNLVGKYLTKKEAAEEKIKFLIDRYPPEVYKTLAKDEKKIAPVKRDLVIYLR